MQKLEREVDQQRKEHEVAKEMQAQHEAQRQTKAATLIQKVFRGYRCISTFLNIVMPKCSWQPFECFSFCYILSSTCCPEFLKPNYLS